MRTARRKLREIQKKIKQLRKRGLKVSPYYILDRIHIPPTPKYIDKNIIM